jgi:threonyl-tRNA synthetase
MLVTGDREAAEGTVSVRSRSAGDLGPRSLDDFIAAAMEEIRTKKLDVPAAAGEETERLRA